jgi:hypothetical protein
MFVLELIDIPCFEFFVFNGFVSHVAEVDGCGAIGVSLFVIIVSCSVTVLSSAIFVLFDGPFLSVESSWLEIGSMVVLP